MNSLTSGEAPSEEECLCEEIPVGQYVDSTVVLNDREASRARRGVHQGVGESAWCHGCDAEPSVTMRRTSAVIWSTVRMCVSVFKGTAILK